MTKQIERVQTQKESNFINSLTLASYRGKDLLEISGISSKGNNQLISIMEVLQSRVGGFFDHKESSPNSRETVDDLFESIQSDLYSEIKGFAEFIFDSEKKSNYFTNQIHEKFLRNYTASLKKQTL